MSPDEMNQTQGNKPRFLTIEQAAEELNVKASLIRGLIKAGELRALQLGGRGYLAPFSGYAWILPAVAAV
ncbi:helix-turn-helix domain-containing protein [Arthrobacter sp. AFG20]|uniref:helix-turn-helix domain-containing protein n=1 Tax=Arthrobacter sp. AFG20 TaxID=1688671 RepID=UPI00215555F3|nr:helix-turn-helix domain-containing protein [Arthrobacter sp. AFG20]